MSCHCTSTITRRLGISKGLDIYRDSYNYSCIYNCNYNRKDNRSNVGTNNGTNVGPIIYFYKPQIDTRNKIGNVKS